MPPLSTSSPLTLIVATTPIRVASTPNEPSTTRLGIGLKGTLPWPRIKTDMSFFARVTSRPPSPGKTNAIIMGRKTYDSVPKHLRPLAKRISAVITRDATGSVRERVLAELEERKKKLAAKAAEKGNEAEEPLTDAIVVPSLEGALSALQDKYGAGLGKVFVIGGAEIYGSALRMRDEGRALRVVMTYVERKGENGEEVPFECDTFWPMDSMDVEGWRGASSEELSAWVGEEVTGEWIKEGEMEVKMVGYERLD